MTKLEAQIRKAQAQAGKNVPDDPWNYCHPKVLQGLIDNGTVWSLEGSAGRAASDALKSGACFLPDQSFADYWGNRIPTRNELKPGTKGTLENSARFYKIN